MKNKLKPNLPPLKSNNDGNGGEINGCGPDEEDGWMLRSYDDFLQQSLECGSFINYKPVKTTTNITTNNRNSCRSQSGGEIKKESNEMGKLAESPTIVSSQQQQLVLIKYKNKNSEGEGGRTGGGGGVQKRREIHSLLFFVFFLFVTIITLSQIIVMHSQTSQSSFYQIKLMQEELKLMDASIDRMLKERHVLPMQVYTYIFQ